MAHLLGFLLSDGSVYYDKSKKTYCIQFTNKSETLREQFKGLMGSCFGVSKFYEIPCKNAVSIRIFSKKISDSLFEYSPAFRTLPCNSFPRCNSRSCSSCKPFVSDDIKYPPCRIPDQVMNKPELAVSFLRGFVSGDGGIYVNKNHSIYTVEIACYHPFLKDQVLQCISSLGIQARPKKKAVIVSGIGPFTKFMDKIGIVK